MKLLSKLSLEETRELMRLTLIDISDETRLMDEEEYDELYKLISKALGNKNKLSEKILSFLLGFPSVEDYFTDTISLMTEDIGEENEE